VTREETCSERRRTIREGIANRVGYECVGCTLWKTVSCSHPCNQEYFVTDKVLESLHSQGVVIKVEGGSIWKSDDDSRNYEATESLIEEK